MRITQITLSAGQQITCMDVRDIIEACRITGGDQLADLVETCLTQAERKQQQAEKDVDTLMEELEEAKRQHKEDLKELRDDVDKLTTSLVNKIYACLDR